MINKNQFNIRNTKKVLHKVGKQWVTVSVALLGLIGVGAAASSVHADTTNQPAAVRPATNSTNQTSTTPKETNGQTQTGQPTDQTKTADTIKTSNQNSSSTVKNAALKTNVQKPVDNQNNDQGETVMAPQTLGTSEPVPSVSVGDSTPGLASLFNVNKIVSMTNDPSLRPKLNDLFSQLNTSSLQTLNSGPSGEKGSQWNAYLSNLSNDMYTLAGSDSSLSKLYSLLDLGASYAEGHPSNNYNLSSIAYKLTHSISAGIAEAFAGLTTAQKASQDFNTLDKIAKNSNPSVTNDYSSALGNLNTLTSSGTTSAGKVAALNSLNTNMKKLGTDDPSDDIVSGDFKSQFNAMANDADDKVVNDVQNNTGGVDHSISESDLASILKKHPSLANNSNVKGNSNYSGAINSAFPSINASAITSLESNPLVQHVLNDLANPTWRRNNASKVNLFDSVKSAAQLEPSDNDASNVIDRVASAIGSGNGSTADTIKSDITANLTVTNLLQRIVNNPTAKNNFNDALGKLSDISSNNASGNTQGSLSSDLSDIKNDINNIGSNSALNISGLNGNSTPTSINVPTPPAPTPAPSPSEPSTPSTPSEPSVPSDSNPSSNSNNNNNVVPNNNNNNYTPGYYGDGFVPSFTPNVPVIPDNYTPYNLDNSSVNLSNDNDDTQMPTKTAKNINNKTNSNYLHTVKASKQNHPVYVLITTPAYEYSNKVFNNHTRRIPLNRGDIVPVKRIFSIGDITRMQLTNGLYVTSNKKYTRFATRSEFNRLVNAVNRAVVRDEERVSHARTYRSRRAANRTLRKAENRYAHIINEINGVKRNKRHAKKTVRRYAKKHVAHKHIRHHAKRVTKRNRK